MVGKSEVVVRGRCALGRVMISLRTSSAFRAASSSGSPRKPCTYLRICSRPALHLVGSEERASTSAASWSHALSSSEAQPLGLSELFATT